MEHHRYHETYIPKTRAERISDTVEFSPKQFNSPEISSIYATLHAAQDLLYALHHPEPEISLFKLGNGHKESLRTPKERSRIENPPTVLPRVTVRAVVQEKLQDVKQERDQMKTASQSKPFTNA